MVLISVIIVTYNSEKVIYACLDSLYQYNDIRDQLEIILVDNSSEEISERTFNKINKLYKPKIKIYRSGGNIGFGRANNIGANLANGEILLFLNPDTILIEPIFKRILETFKEKKTATVGIQMVDENRKKQISFFFIRGYITPLMNMLVKGFNKVNVKLSFMATSGACMFIRKSIFEEVGKFSEEMFLYHEESYLSHKIKNLSKAYRLKYISEIKIVHKEKKTKMSDFLLHEHYKAALYYYNYFGYNLKIVRHIHNFLFHLKAIIYKYLNFDSNYKNVKREREIFNSVF